MSLDVNLNLLLSSYCFLQLKLTENTDMYAYQASERGDCAWYNTPGGGFAFPRPFIKPEPPQPMDMTYHQQSNSSSKSHMRLNFALMLGVRDVWGKKFQATIPSS